jgi:signal transduction histidine kinase
MRVHPENRRALGRALFLLGCCVLAMGAVIAVPALHFELPGAVNIALHTLLETASVAICLLVFLAGVATFRHEHGSIVALVSAAFLGAALLDFVHLLSYTGMPEFVTPSGGGKAIPTFLAARLLVAIALVLVAAMPRQRAFGRRATVAVYATAIGIAAAVSAYSVMDMRFRALFFDAKTGLTGLKVALEYLVIALDLAAAVVFARRLRESNAEPIVLLFTAACLMALSEFALTLYATPVDQYFNAGHAFKIIAYYLIWQAMFRHTVLEPYLHLERAQADILRLNASLEERVNQRTAQLQAVNHELENFSQSLAHDLRSPIGAMRGFGEALAQSAKGRLSEKEQHYLDRIIGRGAEMAGMVEALLGLAHLTTLHVEREPLDIAVLANDVVEHLREAQPSRQVEFFATGALHASGDRRLVSLALENLIGNAWKFTSRKPRARIRLGCRTSGRGQRIFFVEDDGAGFEMAAASKLFRVFQRLHSEAEFPGSGIGLANVSRIVAMHGGRMWAQAKPNEGATFYFTLDPCEPVAAAEMPAAIAAADAELPLRNAELTSVSAYARLEEEALR